MTTTFSLDVAERVARSGATLIAARNPDVPTFAVYVSLACDSRDEARGEEGLGYFVGECLDEGTKRRDGDAFSDALDALGAQFEAGGSGLLIQCPAGNARKALALLVEALQEPAFAAKEVRRVREEILTEIRAEGDDPASVASRRFRREVYGRHPFGRPTHGSARNVGGFKSTDLRRYHKRWHVAEGACIAAVGPGDPQSSLDMLASAFRGFGGERPMRRQFAQPALPDETRDIHLPMDREQVHVYVGHPGIARTHPDYYALRVMDHVLGTGPGFTARITKRLRDELGLCYSVDASICGSARDEPGAFTAYIGTSAEHRQAAIDGFLKEIRRLQRRAPTESEVDDVRQYLTGSYVLGLERNVSLARYLIQTKRYDLGYDFFERHAALIDAVSTKDVQRAARQHLHPDRVVIVSAGASA